MLAVKAITTKSDQCNRADSKLVASNLKLVGRMSSLETQMVRSGMLIRNPRICSEQEMIAGHKINE